MSEDQDQREPTAAERDYPEDEMSVAASIGMDEGVEVGHGGPPVFWIVCVCLVLLWAMVAWKPWKGY